MLQHLRKFKMRSGNEKIGQRPKQLLRRMTLFSVHNSMINIHFCFNTTMNKMPSLLCFTTLNPIHQECKAVNCNTHYFKRKFLLGACFILCKVRISRLNRRELPASTNKQISVTLQDTTMRTNLTLENEQDV